MLYTVVMKSKNVKPSKPTKADLIRQETIEKNTKQEKVELDHPKGKERFASALKNSIKK